MEHNARMTEPAPVLDSSGDEIDVSIATRFKCYDIYEQCDVALSRLVIEGLTYPDLRAQLVVQYRKRVDFKRLPSQIYLMMTLNVCHASFAFKLDDTAKNLSEMKLMDYPGENSSQFANEAQRMIKIKIGNYVFPYQLGSQLGREVCETQSTYFSRTMFSLLDKVLAMGKYHGPHRNPKLPENITDYVKFGPLGICVKMREQYADLVLLKSWPTLAPKITTADLGEVDNSIRKKNPNEYRCHICGSEYHLKYTCPEAKSSFVRGGKGGGTGEGSETTPLNSNDSWRYCAPADKNTTLIVNCVKYYFCKHCVCKYTNKKGFFNRTHTSFKTATTEGHKYLRVSPVK